MSFRSAGILIVLILLLAVTSAFTSPAKSTQDFCLEGAVTYAVGDGPMSVFAANLDSDNDIDLAVANRGDDSVSVLLNNGDGTFQDAVNYAVGDEPWSVFAADLDGDNDKDLAVANNQTDYVSVLLNNGDGSFQEAVSYSAPDRPISVFAADLDGGNGNDLAVANKGMDGVSVLINNGDGTFQPRVRYLAGDEPWSIVAADLDGDSAIDLAVANLGSSSNSVSVLFNKGDGTFQDAVDYPVGIGPASIFAADLDGVKGIDLATANSGNDSASVLLNNGDGTFPAAVNYSVGREPWSIFAAYLDGDSALDLAVAINATNNVSVLINNGDGTFRDAVSYPAGDSLSSVFAADLDGDGDSDLAVTNYSSDHVSVLLNCRSCAEVATPDPASLNPTDGSSGSQDRLFSWSSVDIANKYQVQIDTSVAQDFTSVLWKDTIVSTNSVFITDIPGRIWWRVRSMTNCDTSAWTSPALYTDVYVSTDFAVPLGYRLFQNYPNPFNSSTEIEYSLRRDCHVEVTVYNILGQRVRMLVGEDQSLGPHRVVWDSRDERGREVASGVYFYRIKAAEFEKTKKTVLLK